MAFLIRPAQPRDAEAIAKIYNYYVLNTVITFEEIALTVEEMATRIKQIQSANYPWLIAEENGRVIGYAYASAWKARAAYRHTLESTVYLDPTHVGKGIGSKLYDALFAILREKSIHVVIGVIALPNEASIILHEKFGMHKAAHFSEVGFKFNRWLDVGYWQVKLNS
ncbi:MAG: arsinothricin resistance N-acetyltransferase ArsN1 family B [Burkholderiales bacterium]